MRPAFALALLVLAAARLPAADPTPPAAAVEFFETHVRPVLADHCLKCHGEKKQMAGLRLDTRAGALAGGDTGPAVVPGKPDDSLLVQAVRHQGELKMPESGPLPAAAVAALTKWVALGAPWPAGAAKPATPMADIAKSHWAFRPVRDPAPPAVRTAGWAADPVDRFVLAGIEAAGLAPAPEADRRTLIRRLTFDLHGLPPTPEAVDAFVADRSPAAYEELVDRLLASPHFGERWGRFWLDLARFADTKGFIYADRMEKRFVHSHAYRDWVIRAFNGDRPYDQFVAAQIAADQLGGDRADLAALGFITLGRWLLGVMPDIVDDRIDTVTRATQALTVSCARCHDHKYDPIPTADYYSLYGVFAGSSERLEPLAPIATGSKEFRDGLKARQQKLRDAVRKAADKQAEVVRRTFAKYLAVQPTVDALPTEETFVDLRGDDLVPHIARRLTGYLAARKGDPVWAVWWAFADLPAKEFAARAPAALAALKAAGPDRVNPVVLRALGDAPPADLGAVAEAYGRLFAGLPPNPAAGEDAAARAVRSAAFGPDSPCRLPTHLPLSELTWYFTEDERIALGKLEAEVEAWLVDAPGAVPHAVSLADRADLRNPRVFKRGNPAIRGDEVPRQFLACVAGPGRRPFATGSGRLELAKAIASKDNPLTARVWVNRVWGRLFGHGLVRTPSDFGTRGQPPTHPDLLDHLAARFVADGWHTKALIRRLVLTAAYRQASAAPAAEAADPENKRFARQTRRRLDFEALRDALLAASGELDPTPGGRPDPMFGDAFSPRRTVYGYLDRQFVPGELITFDFASADVHTAGRHETTVPQQALYLLNGPFPAARTRALLARPDVAAADPADRVRRLYRRLFQRPPTARELAAGVRFVGAAAAAAAVPPAQAGVTARNGAWQRDGDELVQTSADMDVGLFFGDPSWSNYTLEVDARRDIGQDGPQLAVRAAGPRQMYWAYFGSYGGKEHGAAKEDGTALSDVGGTRPPGTVSPGRWYKLKVVCKDDNFQTFVDGKKVYEFKDGTYKYGRIGLGAWAGTVRYRNLKVTDADGQVIFHGLPEPVGGPLGPWERYAQVLLLTNEFMFID